MKKFCSDTSTSIIGVKNNIIIFLLFDDGSLYISEDDYFGSNYYDDREETIKMFKKRFKINNSFVDYISYFDLTEDAEREYIRNHQIEIPC